MRWARSIATVGGIGYFPVFPGTIGSLAGLLLYLLLQDLSKWQFTLLLIVLFGIGVYSASLSENFFQKKDASYIVIDELHAMLLVPFLLPSGPIWWIAGFIVFRFFDIKKPPPIRSFEKLPKGWGVMMDDLIAAFYTVGFLRLVEGLIDFGGSTFG